MMLGPWFAPSVYGVQVQELQELVNWLTNLGATLSLNDNNPTPRDVPIGLLDPKVIIHSSTSTQADRQGSSLTVKTRVGLCCLGRHGPQPATNQDGRVDVFTTLCDYRRCKVLLLRTEHRVLSVHQAPGTV